MEFRTRVHQRLDESQCAAGVFLALNSPLAAELLLHGTELDFAAVDLQHGAVSAADSAHMARAIQAADPKVTPMVRLPSHNVYWIQQSLDAGFTGLIVPLVESAEQAEALVDATYFPPRGSRSNAGSIRASLYGDHVAISNDGLLLLPQIESAKGLEHVEQIAAVDGVSGVLVGPVDLSLSCGWFGQDLWSYGPFLDAVKRILAACRAHGKVAAILTDKFFRARDAGFNIIGIAGDAVHIRINMVPDVNATLEQLRNPAADASAG